MNRSKFVSVLAMVATSGILVLSCVKDKGKNPSVGTNTTTTGTTAGGPNMCDTITYASHIKPIIDANCISCHAAGGGTGGFPLLSYDDLKGKAETGRIKARVIDHNPSPMPPTGALPQGQLDLISCWLNNGYKP